MTQSNSVFITVFLLLTACTAPEILEPRDGTVPVGTDLSGNWVIRESSPAERSRIRQAIRNTDGVDDEAVFRQKPQTRSGSRRSGKGGLVYVFLETGTALKITQTAYALFVSFDRSVVEEFRFGENRIVSVGEIEAQRVTGWEGSQLVVETLDKNGMKLTERYRLSGAGDKLLRQITFRSKKLEEETIVQEFDRSD